MRGKNFKTLRAEEKENRRRTLLAIAEEILEEKGFEALTIRDVARKAGLSTGAMYMYFSSKEELLLNLLLSRLAELEENLAGPMALEDPAASIRGMAGEYQRYYLRFGKHIDFFIYLTRSNVDKSDIAPELVDKVRSVLFAILGRVAARLGQPDMQDYLKGLSPERAVAVLWCGVVGLCQVTLAAPRAQEAAFDFHRVLEDFLILFGLKSKVMCHIEVAGSPGS